MLRPGPRVPAAAQPDPAAPHRTPPAAVRTREEFAAALTELRERAGLSVREAARSSEVPLGTVSGWFTGRHVPPPSARDQLVALLRACRVHDDVALAGWVDAAARVRRAPGRRAADAPTPYRGLAGYQADDADWFVGREALTEALVALAAPADPDASDPGLPVVVIGPSGSGKSSLLRAGLVPALAGTHRVAVCSPGRHPAATLQAALERLRAAGSEGDGAPRPALLVVDQLEELFTLADEDERAHALALLAALAGGAPPDGSPVRVVLGVRSDFSSHCMRDPLLARSLQAAQLVVPPMGEAELRRAVVEPARRAGVSVEDGLVDLLLRDLRPSRAGAGTPADASALPLFSHALLATWEHAQSGVLRVADYQAVGGVAGAVARTAEETLAPLDPAGVELARRLLLRLVRLVDGEPVARRHQLLSELVPAGGHEADHDPAADVVARFGAPRLLSSDEDGVALAH
ncbi:MAG: nSTAND1 domain-containing NTPase, partial [Motilibacteraceae bacterium]